MKMVGFSFSVAVTFRPRPGITSQKRPCGEEVK